MEFLYLIVGLILGFVVCWFYLKNDNSLNANFDIEFQKIQTKLHDVTVEKIASQSENALLKSTIDEVKAELKDTRKNSDNFSLDSTKLQSENKNLLEKLETQKAELEKLNDKFTKEFENLANKIFEEKTQKFADQNKTNLGEILIPLGEKIKDFEKKVHDTFLSETKDRTSLKEQLNMLHQLNQQMSKEANNLTKALKGENKTQGNWGEFILESILEKSGLVKDREYSIQQTFTSEDRKRQQPDVIINLPENKCIIIDSKVSLTAYEKYSSAETDEEREIAAKEHLLSVKTHIKTLSDKSYQNLKEINTLDYVILFIAIEPAFILAFQKDPEFTNDALAKNILVVSPTNLLGTLRIIASLWKVEKQTQNAIEIAEKAGALFDKFVGFTEDLIVLGKKMKDGQEAYEAAMNKLSSGSGNLVKKANSIKLLGAKGTKQLDQNLLKRAEQE